MSELFFRNVRRRIDSSWIRKTAWTPKFDVNIVDLPPDVIRCIIKFVVGPSSFGILDDKSLPLAKEAYALCCNHSYLYNIFRQSFTSIFLTHNAEVNVSALARLFGASLRHVSLFMYPYEQASHLEENSLMVFIYHQIVRPDAAIFLDSLAAMNPCLESLSVEMFESGDRFPDDGLISVIKSSASSLRALRLSVPVLDYKKLMSAVAPCLKNLQALCLERSKQLTQFTLLELIKAPGANLRRLVLSDLKHKTISCQTPTAISVICKNATHLEISDMPRKFNSRAYDLTVSVGARLKHLDYEDRLAKGLFGRSLAAVTDSCPALEHVSITCHDVLKPLKSISGTLRSLRLHTLDYLSLDDMKQMGDLFPSLREVYLLEIEGAGLAAQFIKVLGPQLHVLDMQFFKLPLSDPIFSSVSHCTSLHEIAFRRINPLSLKSSDPKLVAENAEKMLRCIGGKLRRFTWTTSNSISFAFWDGIKTKLSGERLASMLARHCKSLEFVHVSGMIPRGSANNSREEVFECLQGCNPGLNLYVDTQPPFWFDAKEYPWRPSFSLGIIAYSNM